MALNVPAQYQTQAQSYISQAKTFNNPLLYFEITTTSMTDTFPNNYPDYGDTMQSIKDSTRSEDMDLY